LLGIPVHIETLTDPELALPPFDQNEPVSDPEGGLVKSLPRKSLVDDQLLANTAEDYIDVMNLNPVRESGAPLLPENPQNEDESLIRDLRKSAILPYPPQATEPLNEYNTVNRCSMAFPTLFPIGRGDLFVRTQIRF
jgi:hypothetical protein